MLEEGSAEARTHRLLPPTIAPQTRYKRAVRADSLVVGQHLIKAPPPHMAKTITRISDFLMKIAASRLSSTIKVRGGQARHAATAPWCVLRPLAVHGMHGHDDWP